MMVLRPASIVPLILLVIVAALALQMIRNHLAFTQLETEVSFWGRGEYMPTDTTRERTAGEIQQLVDATPKDARAHTLQASQQAWESYWQQNPELTENAIKAQKQALDWRPARAQDQRLMVEYEQRSEPQN